MVILDMRSGLRYDDALEKKSKRMQKIHAKCKYHNGVVLDSPNTIDSLLKKVKL